MGSRNGRAEFDGWAGVYGPPSLLERMRPEDLRRLAEGGRAIIAVSEAPVGCAFLTDDGTRVCCGKLAVEPKAGKVGPESVAEALATRLTEGSARPRVGASTATVGTSW